MGIAETPKFPIKGLAQANNQGLVGDATIQFVGSGLVGTAFGFPGISATRIATGVYDIRYPVAAVRGTRIFPHPMPGGAATGAFVPGSGAPVQFDANMSHVGSESGIAYLNTTRLQTVPSLIGGFATGPNQLANPPSGSAVNLLFLFSPISRY